MNPDDIPKSTKELIDQAVAAGELTESEGEGTKKLWEELRYLKDGPSPNLLEWENKLKKELSYKYGPRSPYILNIIKVRSDIVARARTAIHNQNLPQHATQGKGRQREQGSSPAIAPIGATGGNLSATGSNAGSVATAGITPGALVSTKSLGPSPSIPLSNQTIEKESRGEAVQVPPVPVPLAQLTEQLPSSFADIQRELREVVSDPMEEEESQMARAAMRTALSTDVTVPVAPSTVAEETSAQPQQRVATRPPPSWQYENLLNITKLRVSYHRVFSGAGDTEKASEPAFKLTPAAFDTLSQGIQYHIKNILDTSIMHATRRRNKAGLSSFTRISHTLNYCGLGEEVRSNMGMKFGPDVSLLLTDDENAARIVMEKAVKAVEKELAADSKGTGGAGEDGKEKDKDGNVAKDRKRRQTQSTQDYSEDILSVTWDDVARSQVNHEATVVAAKKAKVSKKAPVTAASSDKRESIEPKSTLGAGLARPGSTPAVHQQQFSPFSLPQDVSAQSILVDDVILSMRKYALGRAAGPHSRAIGSALRRAQLLVMGHSQSK